MTDFFFWFFEGDQLLVPSLVEGIRLWHPDSRIFGISDGFYADGLELILQPPQVFLFEHEEGLKELGHCERYLLRGISQVLRNSNAQSFVQLEPDSVIHRRIHTPGVDWCGQIFQNADITATKGAGALFSRQALSALTEALAVAEGSDFRDRKGRPCADLTIAHHLLRLGYSPEPWVGLDGTPEICLLGDYQPSLDEGSWSISHPAKSKFVIDAIFKWKLMQIKLFSRRKQFRKRS